MKSLIIIPAYNEELNLEKVVGEIKLHCPSSDYIIINDGSTDNTENLCRERGFNYITLVSNLGFSGAVQTGYKYAVMNNYDIVAQIDGDGQHPLGTLNSMISLITENKADYVIGSRFVDKKKPGGLRMAGSRIISLLIRLRTGMKINDPTSGMRVVTLAVAKKMANSLNFIAEPDTLTRAILNKFRVHEVQVDMREREHGVSHFRNPFNSIKYMLRMTISILIYQGKVW